MRYRRRGPCVEESKSCRKDRTARFVIIMRRLTPISCSVGYEQLQRRRGVPRSSIGVPRLGGGAPRTDFQSIGNEINVFWNELNTETAGHYRQLPCSRISTAGWQFAGFWMEGFLEESATGCGATLSCFAYRRPDWPLHHHASRTLFHGQTLACPRTDLPKGLNRREKTSAVHAPCHPTRIRALKFPIHELVNDLVVLSIATCLSTQSDEQNACCPAGSLA
jgi:hypothetical protein